MKLRVGIVGAGANTKLRHLPNLQAIPEVEVVSLCNRTRASAEPVARQFGIPKIYDHWHDLVHARDTDAIVIGTWPNLHCPVTIEALAVGKHVLCEARMARNLKEARAMAAAAARDPKLVAQLVPAPFTLGVDATIQRLVREKFIGDVLAVEVRASAGFLDKQAPLHWRQDTELSGLNIMSLGIWYEAVQRWVGEAEQVSATGTVFVPLRRDPQNQWREVTIPEHLTVSAKMKCGAHLGMTISAVAGLSGWPEAWLFGTEGTLRFSVGKLFGGQRGEPALRPLEIPKAEQGGWRVEQEFVDAVRGIAPVARTTFADGLKYMAFTEAVAQSLQANGTAKPVKA